jgi:tRNA/rRNA methyltransferase
MTDQTDTGPAIILVDPQMGENIGMCARAMLNCGMTDLRIVRPRDGWPSQAARDTSSGAIEVIDNAQVFETTREAVADLHRLYATTGRVREMVETVMTPRKAAADIRAVTAAGQRTGVLFGGERSGLTNDDVALAEIILRVPLTPDFKSLNLAQAVLLVGYEWFTAGDETPDLTRDIGDSRPATRVEFDVFLDRLDKGITEGGFFRSPEMRPTVMRNIRNFFLRAEPTDQDIRTLHGIVEALRRGAGDR